MTLSKSRAFCSFGFLLLFVHDGADSSESLVATQRLWLLYIVALDKVHSQISQTIKHSHSAGKHLGTAGN